MKRDEADRIIEEYVKPLYGFSMNKTRNINEAEELAARIILQVYDVLLKKDSIIDLNSYVFKIAHNVWTKYVEEKAKGASSLSIDDVNVPVNFDIDKDMLQSEACGKLRLEIAFLSKQQREIVILYYYKGLKIAEIAGKLNLPEGTIKWHLYEIKKEMKKGMQVIRSVGNLGINPVKFTNIAHSGEPGEKGETSDFFGRTLTQNIAYAAYHEPMTVNSIAQELGISPVYVEDEIDELEKYGFMDKLPGARYQTNMVIINQTEEKMEALNSLYKEYAALAVDEYYLKFTDMQKEFKQTGIYCPDDDYNLLLWSVIPYAMKTLNLPELNRIDFEQVTTHREDGGSYIAFAYIKDHPEKHYEMDQYFCREMYRSNSEIPVNGWQVDTVWSDRQQGWRDNVFSDYMLLYHFINGELAENDVNIDAYARLIEKGYLVKAADGYRVNLVYCGNKETVNKFNQVFPEPSGRYKSLAAELDRAAYEIEKAGQPFRMYKHIKYLCQNKLSAIKPYVLQNFIERGLLKEPSPVHAKAISTILFIER